MNNKEILAEAIETGKTKQEILAEECSSLQQQIIDICNNLEREGQECNCEDGESDWDFINYSDGRWDDGPQVNRVCLKCGGFI